MEIGEYCRTKRGYIAKITEIDNYIWFNKMINKESGIAVYELSKSEFESLVVKHSKNIIDLIEVGDFVNGIKVHSVDYSTNLQTGERYLVIDKIYTSVKYIYEKDIKSILTKEQYEQNSYKL